MMTKEFIAAAEREMLRERRQELRALLEQFTPNDLELSEVLALVAVLSPVAARVAGGAPEPEPSGHRRFTVVT